MLKCLDVNSVGYRVEVEKFRMKEVSGVVTECLSKDKSNPNMSS